MVNVWGNKYSFRTKEVRDVDDLDLEKELSERGWQFMTQKELEGFKCMVELHKVGRLSDKDVVKMCYDLCGWIWVG